MSTPDKLNLFFNEIGVLSEINHKKVIKIVNVKVNGQYCKSGKRFTVVYYIMKLAENGELLKFIEIGKFSEDLARYYYLQLLNGKISIIIYLQNFNLLFNFF